MVQGGVRLVYLGLNDGYILRPRAGSRQIQICLGYDHAAGAGFPYHWLWFDLCQFQLGFCLVQTAYQRHKAARRLVEALESRPRTPERFPLLEEAQREVDRAHDGIFSLLSELFD